MIRGIGAVVLALSVLCACSDPKAGTLPSASPSTSVPPTVTPTPDPEQALVTAARHFYDVLEAAGRDPETGADDVARLLDENCECRRIVEFLREQARRGRRIERPVEVVDPRVSRESGTSGTVFLTLRQGTGRVIDANGNVVEELPASVNEVVLDFVRVKDALLVTQLASDET